MQPLANLDLVMLMVVSGVLFLGEIVVLRRGHSTTIRFVVNLLVQVDPAMPMGV